MILETNHWPYKHDAYGLRYKKTKSLTPSFQIGVYTLTNATPKESFFFRGNLKYPAHPYKHEMADPKLENMNER